MKLYFITGNLGKLGEAQAILSGIEQLDIDLPEIQEINPEEIIKEKLLEAMKYQEGEFQEGEFIVEDTSLYIEAMNGLPGPLIKWFLKTVGNEGLYKMAESFGNFNAKAVTMIGYVNKDKEIKYFKGELNGKIEKPKGDTSFGWDPIFMPDGYDITFGEMGKEEKNKISMRKKAFEELKSYLGA